jgi:hypothetical protein
MRIIPIIVLIGSLWITPAHAGNIAGCQVGSSPLCDGTFADRYCFAQSTCNPGAGCGGGPGTDQCPGRCEHQPWIECATDGPCGGGDSCKGSGTYGLCRDTSPLEDTPCDNDSDCNTDRTGSCTVNGQGCCDLGAAVPYLGDSVCTIISLGPISAHTINGTTGVDHICEIQVSGSSPTTINANSGDDVVISSAPATINAGDGNDIVSGSGFTDTVNGGVGDDWIDSSGGNDTVNGEAGNDFVEGGAGNDSLTGGAYASSGADTSGDDVIFGGDGNDTIIGNGGRDFLSGDGGTDNVQTTACLFGICNASPDDSVGSLLCGGDGNDTLQAWGPRHECLDGGDGSDVCSYQGSYTGGRTVDSADVGTLASCETVFSCGSGTPPPTLSGVGNCGRTTAPCGCD